MALFFEPRSTKLVDQNRNEGMQDAQVENAYFSNLFKRSQGEGLITHGQMEVHWRRRESLAGSLECRIPRLWDRESNKD